MIPNLKNKAYSFVSFPVKAASAVVSNAEGLQKAVKLADTIIDGMQKLFTDYGKYPVLVATAGLRGHLKKYAEIISGLSFIGQVAFWVLPEAGKTRPAWLNPPKAELGTVARLSWATKIASRVFLLPATFIDSLKMLDSFSLLSLGRVASTVIGRVPVLGLVKDSLIVFSSFFSIASSATALVNSLPKWNRARKQCNLWKDVSRALSRPENLALQQRVQACLVSKCVQKHQKYEFKCRSLLDRMRQIDHLDGQPIWNVINDPNHGLSNLNAEDMRERVEAILEEVQDSALEEPIKEEMRDLLDKFGRASVQAREWGGRFENGDLLLISVNDYATAKLDRAKNKVNVELKRLNDLDEAAEGRAWKIDVLQSNKALLDAANEQDYITYRYEVAARGETLDFRKMAKSWIAIANDVAKIAIICFALIGLAFALTSFAWVLVILGLALAVNGIGLFKFLYDELMVKGEVDAPQLRVVANV